MLLLTEFTQTLQFLQSEFLLRKSSIGLYVLKKKTQTPKPNKTPFTICSNDCTREKADSKAVFC